MGLFNTTTRQQSGNVIFLGVAQTLAWASTYYLPAILAAPMARDLGVSTPFVFGAFSLALVVAALVGPRAGAAIDRWGGRPVLAWTSLVFAVGLFALGFATGPWRGAITGITLIAGFASTVGWPLSTYLEAHLGWRETCWAWAAMHVLIGLPLNLALPKLRPAPPLPVHAPDPSESGTPPAPKARTATFVLAFVFATTWFISTAMAAHLPALLQAGGIAVGTSVLVGMLIGPAQVGARLLEFGFLRRVHPLVTARWAAALHPLGVAALLIAGPPAAVLFGVLHGAGNGILTIAKGTLPLAVFGPTGYGHRQGVLMVPARIAQALAPWSFGLALAQWGHWALLVTSAMGVLAVGALFFITAASAATE